MCQVGKRKRGRARTKVASHTQRTVRVCMFNVLTHQFTCTSQLSRHITFVPSTKAASGQPTPYKRATARLIMPKKRRSSLHKRSHDASERGRPRETTKSVKLPTRKQCLPCGQKFPSQKTAKHKCLKAKVKFGKRKG